MSAFDRIIGYEDVKTELKRICDILRNPKKYEKLGVKMPKGLMFVGEPGVGKTTMAKSFIEETGRNVFICRKKKPDGEFVKEISDIFEQAKQAVPSIVLLDDMDKYANEDEKHKNAEEFVAIQSCVDDVKDLDIFVIGTANCLKDVPDSLLRAGRFDKSIEIDAPTGEDAENIIKYYLSKKEFVANIDAAEIAAILSGKSCADLETVINEAGIYAGYDNKEKIDMSDVIKACLRIIYDAPEKTIAEGENLELIAYHEAGHAVLSEILTPESVKLVTVKKNHGIAGGFTIMVLPKNYWHSKRMMENRVIALLGGKAATEITYGTVDVGADSDLTRAFNIVERLVDDYCSKGFHTSIHHFEVSNDLLARRELSISHEMEYFYEQAKKILIDNRASLIAIANALVKEETITGSRVRKLISENIIKAS